MKVSRHDEWVVYVGASALARVDALGGRASSHGRASLELFPQTPLFLCALSSLTHHDDNSVTGLSQVAQDIGSLAHGL
jgi:hypothetical protein